MLTFTYHFLWYPLYMWYIVPIASIVVFKSSGQVCVTVQWGKQLLRKLTPFGSASDLILPLLLSQLPATMPRKQQRMAPNTCVHVTMWETQMEILAPGFTLGQYRLLLAFGEWNRGWKINLFLLSCPTPLLFCLSNA